MPRNLVRFLPFLPCAALFLPQEPLRSGPATPSASVGVASAHLLLPTLLPTVYSDYAPFWPGEGKVMQYPPSRITKGTTTSPGLRAAVTRTDKGMSTLFRPVRTSSMAPQRLGRSGARARLYLDGTDGTTAGAVPPEGTITTST